MTIIISSEANAPTPPAGEATLFINTDKNNILYVKYPDGSLTPYNGSNDENAGNLASEWLQAISCALKSGMITASNFEDIMSQGIAIQSSSVTDGSGNTTSTFTVGSRETILNSITLDTTTTTIAVSGTHQITTTFDPTGTTNKGLLYITSNSAKATVSATGLITGVATGSAVITVIPIADPSKAKTVTVTIS